MRVVVTGAGGQVGRETVEVCEAAGDDVIAFDHAGLDVVDRARVLGTVATVQPDVVVHAAAWTAVDACEADPDKAFQINGLATRHVVEAARRTGAHLVYISTDYVFDGTLDRPYNEWDRPNPQSAYGRSKYAGELELAGNAEATIVRISWVCGRYGHNMVKTILRLAGERDELSFVDDQHGHPTIVGDLAPMLRRLAAERRPGTFHVTNQGLVSWYDFARDVMMAAGHDPERVRPIKTAELDPPRPAPRPANSALDNAALRLSRLPLLPDYRQSIGELVRTVLADSKQSAP